MVWSKKHRELLLRGMIQVSLSALLGLNLIGCSAVYPESKTAVRVPAKDAKVDPPPAADLYYIYFDGAKIPAKTQDGRKWPGGAPDPIAKLVVDEQPLIVTPTEPNTLEPTWEKQEKGNVRVDSLSRVYVELWDADPMANRAICRERIRSLESLRDTGVQEIWCDSGARVRVVVESAHALLGLGLYYETRGQDGVRVTRVVGDSPASRAGLSAGDRILAIQGKPVRSMDALKVRSTINEHARVGLKLDVWFHTGKRHEITIKEGALYPLDGDNLRLED